MDTEIKQLLKQLLKVNNEIVKNTSPKENHKIIVSGNTSNFVTTFNPTLELNSNKKYEMALIDLETYYSFPNINKKNNIIEYEFFGEKRKRIEIPTGSWGYKNLNKEIQQQLIDNGDEMHSN